MIALLAGINVVDCILAPATFRHKASDRMLASKGKHLHKNRHRMVDPAQNKFIEFDIVIDFNGIPYNVMVDSGSYSMVIKGKGSCQGDPKKRLDCSSCPQLSSSVINYLDGPVSTTTYSVNISMPGQNWSASATPMVYSSCSDEFEDMEGMVGIHYQNDSTNLLYVLDKYKIVSQKLMTIAIRYMQDDNNFVAFGQSRTELASGPLQTIPFVDHWTYYVQISKFGVAGKFTKQNMKMLFDTGNSNIMLSTDMAQAFRDAIQDAGLSDYCYFEPEDEPEFNSANCYGVYRQDLEQLPDLQWVAQNGVEITLSVWDYLGTCSWVSKKKGTMDCQLGVQQDVYQGQMTLGLPFFEHYLAVIDYGNNTIQIGPYTDQFGEKDFFN